MQPMLNLNISQKTAMTPQLAESIRFLQLSAAELAEELKSALDDNVMLEEDSAADTDETDSSKDADDNSIDWKQAEASASEDWGSHKAGASGGDYHAQDHLVAPDKSVHMRMLEQIQLCFDDDRSLAIAAALIDATDDSGYLAKPVAKIVAGLSTTQLVLPGEVEDVLRRVQRLDPVGFAARSLSECLRVQLEELHDSGNHDIRLTVGLALQIVDLHMDALAAMDIDALVKATQQSEPQVAAAVRLIRSLSPKPAAAEHAAVASVPDVVLKAVDDGWSVELNNNSVPRLCINSQYEKVVSADPSAKALREQLQDARWLLRSVDMRNDTLLRATRFIFEHQPDFLSRGEVGLRPLTLKFVADGIGVHESTISRITTSKFVQTPHGVFSLKTFFPSQLTVAQGVASSGAAVKATIAQLIARETPEKPLRDVDLTAIFARRGVRIARRTIAKYREALGIASSRERQEQYRRENQIRRRVNHRAASMAV